MIPLRADYRSVSLRLLLALLVLSALTLLVLRNFSDVEMSENIPWEKVLLGLGVTTAAVAVVKSLLDAGSSWASYGFVALAVAVGVGTYIDWAAARRERQPLLTAKRRGIRPAA